MLKNYIKIAWRNLSRSSKSSAINIIGLSLGLAVFTLIAIWVWDELSYDKYHKNYERIGQAVQLQQWNGQTYSQTAQPLPLKEELELNYRDNFKCIVMASWERSQVLSHQDRNLSQSGIYMDVDGPKMLSLTVLHGTIGGLQDPNSIMLSQSAAKAFFRQENPVGQLMKINQTMAVRVTAVYADLPDNTTFRNLKFIAPWDLYVSSEAWIQNAKTQWGNNSFQLFAQIADGLTFETVNHNIANAKLNRVPEEEKKFKAQIVLHPMKNWRLRNEWKNGKVVGGLITYVKLFSIIGIFILVLACINFMNLSTARSEKRAKEVGIRKAIGSSKYTLIAQFLSESVLLAFLAGLLAICIAFLLLPWFNNLAGKQMVIPFGNPWFWLISLCILFLTGLFAGSYPAFYLSAFQPLAVLKGTFRIGSRATLPRKFLVTFQFSISILLVIGTIIIFKQILFIKNRPVGYEREGLAMIYMNTADFYGKYDILSSKLKQNGSIEEMAESSSPLTAVWSNSNNFDWPGKDPGLTPDFGVISTTPEYGKTVKWRLVEGRDFSRNFGMDSLGFVINKAAAQFMGIKNPIGKEVHWGNRAYHILGIVDDMVMSSPFDPVKPTIYLLNPTNVEWIILRLNPNNSTAESLEKIKQVFHEVIPNAPFEYLFADESYAEKFRLEEAIGQLALTFATLAIVISCLGVLGLASYLSERRSKELGIRKVIGASVFQLWRLISLEFALLAVLASVIACPLAYYFLSHWLQNYTYHTTISSLIFIGVIIGTVLLTLTVVSLQTIKAAIANPVDSLRNE